MEFTDRKEIRIPHTTGPVEVFYKFDRAVSIRKVSIILKSPHTACDVFECQLLNPQNQPLLGFSQTDPPAYKEGSEIIQHFVGWKLLLGKGSLIVTFSNFSDSVSEIVIGYEVI